MRFSYTYTEKRRTTCTRREEEVWRVSSKNVPLLHSSCHLRWPPQRRRVEVYLHSKPRGQLVVGADSQQRDDATDFHCCHTGSSRLLWSNPPPLRNKTKKKDRQTYKRTSHAFSHRAAPLTRGKNTQKYTLINRRLSPSLRSLRSRFTENAGSMNASGVWDVCVH